MQKDKQKVMFYVDTAKKKLDPKLPLRALKSSIAPSFWWPSMKLADIATLINLRVTFLVGVGELQPVMSLSRSTECSVRLPAVVRGSKEGAGLGGEGCGQRKKPTAALGQHSHSTAVCQTNCAESGNSLSSLVKFPDFRETPHLVWRWCLFSKFTVSNAGWFHSQGSFLLISTCAPLPMQSASSVVLSVSY